MEKKQSKNTLKNILTFFVGVVVFFFVFSSFFSMVRKYISAQNDLREQRETRKYLQHKKEMLTGRIADLQTPEGRELYLRQKYRVVAPGEELIVLSDPKPFSSEQEQGFFRRLFGR